MVVEVVVVVVVVAVVTYFDLIYTLRTTSPRRIEHGLNQQMIFLTFVWDFISLETTWLQQNISHTLTGENLWWKQKYKIFQIRKLINRYVYTLQQIWKNNSQRPIFTWKMGIPMKSISKGSQKMYAIIVAITNKHKDNENPNAIFFWNLIAWLICDSLI